MTVTQDIIDEIENLIRQASSIQYNKKGPTNDIFESYVWLLCIEAAQQHGARITFNDKDGNDAKELIFRTSPGAIYSDNSEFTHALIEFENCPALEAHIGIRVTGKSRVLHECDVSVIYAHEAYMCRRYKFHPRSMNVLIAVECKFYETPLQLHLGRGFLGLAKDITEKERYFVTNTESKSIQKLIAHYQSEWECNVIPSSREAEDLRARFSRAFRNFKIQNESI